MNYKEYIELGFKRHDLDDSVEMDNTGYGGYFLKYQLNKKISIEVYYDELQTPRLFIEKKDDKYGIIDLSLEQLNKLVKK